MRLIKASLHLERHHAVQWICTDSPPSRWTQKATPTYLMRQFCKQSRAAGCTAPAATRRPRPSWWRRHRPAAPWCRETCRASCCSPGVSRPPSSQSQLKANRMGRWIWGDCQSLIHRASYGSLLSLLSRKPNHTVWWMKPKDHSCSRTKRFSFSLSMVKISVLLPGRFKAQKLIKNFLWQNTLMLKRDVHLKQ